MAIIKESEIKFEAIKQIGIKMMIAARTAPKGRGMDNLEVMMLHGYELELLAQEMRDIAKEDEIEFFNRDAEGVLSSSVIILLGTKINPLGLKKCGLCGFDDCSQKNKHENVPCVFNTGDLGIAIGSAVSVAMDNRVDNRVMFSIGKAAIRMGGIFSKEIKIAYGIPLSAYSKNPFFDRK